MFKDRKTLNRTVTVTAQRKGNGAIGGGRKGHSGKKGVIKGLDESGKQVELARATGTTMKDLSRELRKTGLIPEYVSLNSKGDTTF